MGQKKKTGEKQPKETDKIKKKLERVATLKRRIDNLIERLEYLESTMGSASTPNLTGRICASSSSFRATSRSVLLVPSPPPGSPVRLGVEAEPMVDSAKTSHTAAGGPLFALLYQCFESREG